MHTFLKTQENNNAKKEKSKKGKKGKKGKKV